MNWHVFEHRLKDKHLLLFSKADLCRLFGCTKTSATFLLHRYGKKGYIIKLKRGLYTFPDTLPPELLIANSLYKPSYVSLEFALSYHGLIPEAVYEITSITTKSSRRFHTLGKIFSYRSLKKKVFTGYRLEKQDNAGFFIADPEKAYVDTLYFRMFDGLKPMSRIDVGKIRPDIVWQYAKLFDNPNLTDIIRKALR